MFPKSSVSTAGNNFNTQNTNCGNFHGVIESIRAIKSKSNPTVFAVLDIKVKGEADPFQSYLNYNKDKEEQSVAFLVNHAKRARLSAGYDVDMDAEKDMEWVEKVFNSLIKKKDVVYFKQSKSGDRYNLQFIPEVKDDTDEDLD